MGHFNKKNRNVRLKGEAFFCVTRDKKHPFVVQVSDYKIKVFGTKFNVMAYDTKKRFETTLIEGSVSVISNSVHINLSPNQEVVLNNNHLCKQNITHKEHLLWRKGIYSIKSQTMRNIFSEMELYYDVKIECTNPMINNTYTGKFRIDDGCEHMLKVLQHYYNFTYSFSNDRKKVNIR